MQDLPPYLPIYSLISSSAEKRRRFYQLVVADLITQGLRPATAWLSIAAAEHENSGEPQWCTPSLDGCPVYRLKGTREELLYRLVCLARTVDILLLENDRDLGFPRILLDEEGAAAAAASITLATFDLDRQDAVHCLLQGLEQKLAARPVWACILMGGRSSRMGRPKHLLLDEAGRTWLERTVRTVQPQVAGVVLSGRGEIPAALDSLPRLADIPEVGGPLTGILSAMRWQPDVSWLFLACDMPEVTAEAVAWLLGERKVGRWGAVPRRAGQKRLEPLFAGYEPQCAALFERLGAAGIRRIGRIADFEKISVVRIPDHLEASWQNINTPEELCGLLPAPSPPGAGS